MEWMSKPSHRTHRRSPASDDFYTWLERLPWVVERQQLSKSLGVRAFAIACEPLDVDRLWLVGDVFSSVAVIVLDSIAQRYASEGLGDALAPMSERDTLFGLSVDVPAIDLERVVLEAYDAVLTR